MGKRSARVAALRAVVTDIWGRPSGDGVVDLNAAIIKSVAPHVLILEIERERPIYRVAGSAIQRAFGHDPFGKSFYANWDCSAHQSLESFFRAAIKSRQPFCALSINPRSETERVRYETVLIPVTMPVTEKDCFIGTHIPLDGEPDDFGLPAAPQNLQHITFVHDDLSPAPSIFPHLVHTAQL